MDVNAFLLAGPTAVGKTEIAHRLALRHGYDILSADAMLLYRGMDIGTAKPTPAQRSEVRYFGIDLADPRQSFSVADYLTAVAAQLDSVPSYMRRPLLVVGGTGLYLKALTMGLDTAGPPPDPERRRLWEALASEQGVEALGEALRRLSPTGYERLSDKRNPRRLIRALEWCEAGFAAHPAGWRQPVLAAPMIGLRMEHALLHLRIAERAGRMLRDGLLGETARLSATGLGRTAGQAIGYAEAMACLAGQMTEDAALERIIVRTRQLAKKQMTWLRHQAWVEWITLDSGAPIGDIMRQISEAWTLYGSIPLALP